MQRQACGLPTMNASNALLVPDSAAFAGKYGDGLITVGGKQPQVYRELIRQFEKGAREAGKDPSKMPRLVELNVAYTNNIESSSGPR